jgi:hypothetical protein
VYCYTFATTKTNYDESQKHITTRQTGKDLSIKCTQKSGEWGIILLFFLRQISNFRMRKWHPAQIVLSPLYASNFASGSRSKKDVLQGEKGSPDSIIIT